GSILEHNTDLSIKFKEKIENDERYVTYFPKRSVFNKSMSDGKSISQKYEDNELNCDKKQFMKEYKERINKVKLSIDNVYQEKEKIKNKEKIKTYITKRSILNKYMSKSKSISQKYEDNELNRDEKQFMKEYKERMNTLKQAVDNAYQEIENA